MRVIIRLLLLSVCSSAVFLASVALANINGQSDECKPSKNLLFTKILSKIENYSLAESYLTTCAQIEEINKIPVEEIRLTTKRKRGKDLICLSTSDNSKPCMYKLGYFTGDRHPDQMLCDMFPDDCDLSDKSIVLTETVERLYLRPSSLIR